MKDLVLFDLDGTLALVDHRRHLVSGRSRRWREFFAQCVHDELNEAVAAAWHAHKGAGHEVWIVSGRSDEVKRETHAWLKKHGLVPDRMFMRDAKDNQPDVALKRGWLQSGAIPRDRVICVYDDRNGVVQMWRDEGIPCFQVAPGDF